MSKEIQSSDSYDFRLIPGDYQPSGHLNISYLRDEIDFKPLEYPAEIPKNDYGLDSSSAVITPKVGDSSSAVITSKTGDYQSDHNLLFSYMSRFLEKTD